MSERARLMLGDCLERMAEIPDGSVDLVLADLPYGTTACKWDVIIPFEPLWAHYRRVLKSRGAVVLTACQPFTSLLVLSNRRWFRYEDVWDKVGPTGYLDANRRPLRRHENVLVFSPAGSRTFNRQMTSGEPYRLTRGLRATVYGGHKQVLTDNHGTRCPTSVIKISNANWRERGKGHPTQKPVALAEYLIRTYSNPGETVLDNAMGSGSFGVAALNMVRQFIGIERDPGYFAIAERRIAEALNATPLLAGT